MRGRILPAGSPLVQFEVQRSAHDVTGDFPFTVWVDPRPRKPMQGCPQPHAFRVVMSDIGHEITRGPDGLEPGCCFCMGRFVE